MTTDPFAQTGTATADDPFGDPTRGKYPKVAELLHKLLVLRPVKVEQVQRPNSKDMQDRWSVDTYVFEEDGTVTEYDAMYWSQTGIASAMAKAAKSGKPVIGTLHLFPAQNTKKTYSTEDQLLQDEAVKFWLGRGGVGLPPTPVAWGLEPATPEQRQRAATWWMAQQNPFASA